MNYQEFEFVVEEMTADQADELMDRILDYVESKGLSMGGGCQATTDLDYPPFLVVIEAITFRLVRLWKRIHRHG